MHGVLFPFGAGTDLGHSMLSTIRVTTCLAQIAYATPMPCNVQVAHSNSARVICDTFPAVGPPSTETWGCVRANWRAQTATRLSHGLAPHGNTSHQATLHNNTFVLRYITLPCNPLICIALHGMAWHGMACHVMSWHCITAHCPGLVVPCLAVPRLALPCVALSCIP